MGHTSGPAKQFEDYASQGVRLTWGSLCMIRWNALAGHMEKDEAYNSTLESLEERFAKHASQGGVGESGGCTDASVRLSTLLKVTEANGSCCIQRELNILLISACGCLSPSVWAPCRVVHC